MNCLRFFSIVLASCCSIAAWAQEHEAALNENPFLRHYQREATAGQARINLNLPFFEDFTDYGYYPNNLHWSDSCVYLNNTLAINPISRGQAIFDALDARGLPYNTQNNSISVKADSLTSHYFDFSTKSAADAIYLSFVYQPKGHGFAPKPQDSLSVYFANGNGFWQKVWSVGGSDVAINQTAIIPVNDPSFFHSDFRFRIVNKATIGLGNAQWIVDYIKLAAGRSSTDTFIDDVATTVVGGVGVANPSFLLEYTSMPYRHFAANSTAHMNTSNGFSVRNNTNTNYMTQISYRAVNRQNNSVIAQSGTNQMLNSNSLTFIPIGNISPSNVVPVQGGPLLIDEHFYISSNLNDYSRTNDSIMHTQVFDNYFAYDDGSAESAYFMSSYPGAASYVAQEYALDVADTLRGVNIYFPQQVPSGAGKEFFLQIYKHIDANGTPDELVYEEQGLDPRYEQQVNGFATYALNQGIPLPAGTFYVALMFPAGGISDSLYIGLDKNKTGANHRYIKTGINWQPSLIDGALMIRPIVGAALPMKIPPLSRIEFQVFPNPHQTFLNVQTTQGWKHFDYEIVNSVGKKVLSGTAQNKIATHPLPTGVYFMRIGQKGHWSAFKKIVKE